MKRALSMAIVWGALLASSAARAANPDVVHLKNGGRIQGTVVDDDPQVGVTVKLADGTSRKVSRAQIASVDYASDKAAAAAPSPAAPAALASPAPPLAAAAMPARARVASGDANDGDDAVPAGHHVERRSIKALWLTGLIVDLGVWGARAGVSLALCAANPPCDGRQYAGIALPVFGAWIQASAGVTGEKSVGPKSGAQLGALIGSGIVEGAGFVMLVTGLVVHRNVVVDGPDAASASLRVGPVRLAPSFSGRAVGVTGSF